MSIERFKDDLLLSLLSLAQRSAPVELEKLLRRKQFVAGDVTFHETNSGRYWTSINRWPWEPRRVCVDCGVTLHRDAVAQGFETCSSCAAMRRWDAGP
jgi:hypothetical protein